MLAIPFYQFLFTKPLGPDIVNVFCRPKVGEKIGAVVMWEENGVKITKRGGNIEKKSPKGVNILQ